MIRSGGSTIWPRAASHLAVLLVGLQWALPAFPQRPAGDLADATIEELMNIKVTTAGKKEQTLATAPAAVYVITQQDIRRSGVTTVADALRLAPGVQVAQISANSWAISIRGFNYRFADKLLVMIDGRTIYSPVFSGVFWELHDLPLEDIDRIEVVRGPGGTLWGANAMNGVINIITKRARDTQGLLMTAAAGTRDSGMGTVRFGGAFRSALAYRIYGKYSRNGRSPALQAAGQNAYDAWDMLHTGFRADWSPTPKDQVTFSGDVFRGNEEDSYPLPLLVPPFVSQFQYDFVTGGGNVLGRWKRDFSARSSMTLQMYYDRAMRAAMPGFSPLSDVFDVDLQHAIAIGERHQLVWGGGFRSGREHAFNNIVVGLVPSQQTLYTLNAFLQDEVTVARNRLWLTLGSKFEHNGYAGIEVQPNVRLRWQWRPQNMIWLAVSRALTTPNDFQEIGYRVSSISPGPGGVPTALLLLGNRQLKSQDLTAYEAGYRTLAGRRLALDLTAFFNSYHRYVGAVPGQPYAESIPPPLHLVVPLNFANNLTRHNYGLEFSGTFAPYPSCRLKWGYSWLVNGAYPLDITDVPFRPGDDAKHQFQVQTSFSLPRHLEFDSGLFYVGRLPAQNLGGYFRLDGRLGWQPSEHLEISVAGQNLLDPRHPEFTGAQLWTQAAQVAREAYVKLTWRFGEP